jgi:hypothetical protein
MMEAQGGYTARTLAFRRGGLRVDPDAETA